MKHQKLLLIAFVAATQSFADVPAKYARIRLFVPDQTALSRIWESGLDYEGSTGRPGGWMEFIAGTEELNQLTLRQIRYSILQDDLSRTSAPGPAPANALGFGYGSMGGYYTYSEVVRQLDSMRTLYPAIVSLKDSIGSTSKGRAIWAVRISDEPDGEDPSEPGVLYTALHHAREPEGMMTVIYYMWWLLEHYGNDPSATYLVNTRQMWFIPVVNPDGYVYNETVSPTGGGFWRKNRRANGGGTYGIDLNRNYGPYEMWNAPNGGSSTSPGSDTYRGTAPFSEPETWAIADFLSSHDIRTCLNYHTFGNYLIYPWGYRSQESDDSLTFREFAFDMVRTNRHASGTDLQTVNYSTRGTADDFMFGDLTKPQTYAMTPEVGSAFWPPTNQILPLAQANLEPNIYYSLVAGQHAVMTRCDVLDANMDGALLTGEAFSLKVTVRNKGLGDAHGLEVSVSCSSPSIVFSAPTAGVADLAARSDQQISFPGSVTPYGPLGVPLPVLVTIRTPDGYWWQDTARIVLGEPIPLLADGGDVGTINWTTGAGWNTTNVSHSAPYAFTDSPAGSYAPLADNALTTALPIDLEGYGYAVMKFWTLWAIEPSFDFGVVEASTNGGSTWTALRASLSHSSSGKGMQAGAAWGFDGYTPGLEWVEQEIDLSELVGQPQIYFRFRLSSDGTDQRDGWYLDDLRILAFNSTAQFSALTVSDHGDETAQLFFGESLFATDGLDPLLDEQELGPKPPAGTFDARWRVPATSGTRLDLRDTLATSGSANRFTLEFQPGPGGYPVTLRWDPRGYLSGGWHLRDGSTHGALFNVNMLADTSFSISQTSVTSLEIVHAFDDSVGVRFNPGWNIVSLPMRGEHPPYAAAISRSFAYEGSYVIAETLSQGKGYWAKFASADSQLFTGAPVVEETLSVADGWHLSGGVSVPLRPDQILRDPPANVFTYAGGRYSLFTSGELLPGQGFWIKGPTKAVLSPYGHGTVALPKEEVFPNSLRIADAGGNSATLTFGVGGPGTLQELPPPPPPGTFDARFASQRATERFPAEGGAATILIQTPSYPVTVSWDAADPRFELVDAAGVSRQSLTGQGSKSFTDGGAMPLRLVFGNRAAPAAYALEQNYPNPFNPSTLVEFDLPALSQVTLSVFDLLGRELLVPVPAQLLPAGRFHATIDGTGLASGVYVCRLRAQPAEGGPLRQFSRKMTLIR